MELKRIISYFPERDKSDAPEDLFHHHALERIRDGASRALVEQIRAETDKAKRNKLKGKLPCVCFSGHFLKRKNEAITKHSGFIVLDFDDAADPVQLRTDLSKYSYVKAAWLSPSGTGVKCLVRVPDVISQHRGHFAALEKTFPDIDPSGKDEARICYESYDPDIYINPEPAVFEGYEVPDQAPPKPVGAPTSTRSDYSKINICVTMIRKAVPGTRNETLLKASRLAGGFIAAGYIPEAVALEALDNEVRAIFDASEVAEELHTIRNGIAYGKNVPVYDQIPEEQPAPKTQTTHSIKFLASCWDTMKDQHKNGKVRGTPTYMPGLERHFSWKKKELTLGSGYANTGKSEWWYQKCLLKSVNDGTKWAVFGPEAGDPEEFYDGLIHTLVGKSVDPAYNNQMTLDQYREAAEFIGDHFFFIDPDIEHTIADVEANFEYCIKELGCEGVILDPFNALADKTSERDDKHLQDFLNKRIRFARNMDIYYIIIAHPNGNRKLNKDGEYDVVGYFDLAGGAMWSNKIHNFIVVHRPFQNTEPENTTVDIYIKKIKKQRLVGVPGIVRYSFDRATNRYMWFNPATQRTETPFSRINSDAPGKKGGKLS